MSFQQPPRSVVALLVIAGGAALALAILHGVYTRILPQPDETPDAPAETPAPLPGIERGTEPPDSPPPAPTSP